MLQPVAPTSEALWAATSDALLVEAAAPEQLAAAVQDTVVAMRQAHGYYQDGHGQEGDLQVSTWVGGWEVGWVDVWVVPMCVFTARLSASA